MRIAILILAHKNPNQLQLLVDRLQQDFDVYIHLDKKSNLSEKQFEQYPNVFCIKKYSTNWGSYNGILAPLELFKIAGPKNYDYYIHISGQDLPIKSNKFITDFLNRNRSVNFVNWHRLPVNIWGEDGGFGRIRYFWEHNYGFGVIDLLKKLIIRIIRKFQFKFNWKRKLPDMAFYGGSNWVNITGRATSILLDYIEKHPDYLQIFKYSCNADELWMQTVLKNAGLNLETDYLRCINWGNNRTSPNVFTMKDLDTIMAHNGLFARKFDENVDKEVIEVILQRTENSK